MSNNITTYYEFVLAQFAADSYLNDIDISIRNNEYEDRLRFGANNFNINTVLDRNILSPTQMTEVMLDDYFETWQIITHLPNQTSGLSATLLQHRETGEFTLSFRSSEIQTENLGGDIRRDGFSGSFGEIRDEGFAIAQLRDMQIFYENLINGKSYDETTGEFIDDARLSSFASHINDDGQINVTGYSSGAHLAQVFTRLHNDDVLHTYTFNGAGFGDFEFLQDLNEVEGSDYAINIDRLLTRVDEVINDPLSFIDNVSSFELLRIIVDFEGAAPILGPATFVLERLGRISRILGIPDISAIDLEDITNFIITEEEKIETVQILIEINDNVIFDNIYANPLFAYASRAAANILDVVGAQDVSLLELLPDVDVFETTQGQITLDDKITNLFGQSPKNVVAGSGQIFGEYLPVYVEDQPFELQFASSNSNNRTITDFLSDSLFSSFGEIHSITLIADTLALMKFVSSIDSNLTLNNLNTLVATATNSRAESIIPGQIRAEGDSLETVLNILGRFFLPETWEDIISDSAPGQFGDIGLRNTFHDAIEILKAEILENGSLKPEYGNLGLRIKNIDDLNASELEFEATQSVAYRYALQELNSFVIEGLSAAADDELYVEHNVNGELEFDSYSSDYWQDRAEFLALNVRLNLSDSRIETRASEDKVFLDLRSGTTLASLTNLPGRNSISNSDTRIGFTRSSIDETEFLGAADQNQFRGNDRLYGGFGNDTLAGGVGSDTLEGNRGNDTLIGGSGSDTLLGGDGDDILFNNLQSDILIDDNVADTLEGGNGVDTYFVGNGDSINDSDGTGSVVFKRSQLAGGVTENGGETYESLGVDGKLIYALDNTTSILTVTLESTGESLTINDFTDGDLGIRLRNSDEPSPVELIGSNDDDNFGVGNSGVVAGSDPILGDEKDLYILEGSVNGEVPQTTPGPEVVLDNAPNLVIGGLGSDRIQHYADLQNLVVYGDLQSGETSNDGDDFILLDAENLFLDIIPTDTLNGSIVYAGGGDDFVGGSQRNDQLYGGSLHDFLAGNYGNDLLFGGSGNDWLQGNANSNGADFLYGDEGNDRLYGGAGIDILFGGEDNDILYGDNDGGSYFRTAAGAFWDGATETITVFDDFFSDLQFITQEVALEESGDDRLDGGAGNDSLFGGAGNDTLWGRGDNDKLYGEGGDDILEGGSGFDVLWGDKDPEVYARETERRAIDPSDPNDLFVSREHVDGVDVAGNDTLDGGSDSDILKGGGGNDTYIFGLGYGVDVIEDSGGELDAIQLTAGITTDDVTLTAAGSDLIISLTSGEQLIINNWYAGEGRIEQLRFADGVTWNQTDIERETGKTHDDDATPDLNTFINFGRNSADVGFVSPEADTFFALGGSDLIGGGLGNDRIYGGVGNDELQGNEGNDQLIGETGNDRLFGGEGNDTLDGGRNNDILNGGEGDDTLNGGLGGDRLFGGLGDDTYEFNRGDDVDSIFDEGGNDTISFGADISPDDVRFDLNATNLFIRLTENGALTGDQITINDWQNDDHRIETIQFADGTAWDYETYQTMLPSVIDLTNNSTIQGGNGRDDYFFFPGNITDGFNVQISDAGGYDRLTFETDSVFTGFFPVPFQQPTLTSSERNGNDLILNIEITGNVSNAPERSGTVTISDYYTQAGFIEEIRFANTLLNPANDTPEVSNTINNQVIRLDEAYSFSVPQDVITDSEFDLLTYTATRADGSDLPDWLSFDDTTLTFSGTPTNGDSEFLDITLTATDRTGLSASTSYQINVGNINVAPEIQNPIETPLFEANVSNSIVIPSDIVSDSNLDETLTVEVVQADGSALPVWLSFDAATQTLSGTPPVSDPKDLNLQYRVTDSAGLMASTAFMVRVDARPDAQDDSVSLQLLADSSDLEFTFDPRINDTDADNGDSLSVLTINYNDVRGLAGNEDESITFIPQDDFDYLAEGEVETLSIAYTLGDDDGLTSTGTVLLDVIGANNAPEINTFILDQQLTVDDSFSFVIASDTFVDVDNNDILTLTAELTDGSPLPSWLSFNSTTGEFSGTPTIDDLGAAITVELTATDNLGEEISQDITFTVTTDGFNQITGTFGNDNITGTSGNDVINSLGGEDTLLGGDGLNLYTYSNVDSGTDTFTFEDVGQHVLQFDSSFSSNDLEVRIFQSPGAVRTNESFDIQLFFDVTTFGSSGITFRQGITFTNAFAGEFIGNEENGFEFNGVVEAGLLNADRYSFTFDDGTTLSFEDIIDIANTESAFAFINNGIRIVEQGEVFNGASGNEEILGTSFDDIVNAASGDDEVSVGGGDDQVNAGLGNDQVNGGFGDDSLFGNEGSDNLDGGLGNDVLNGGDDDDFIHGRDGNDTLIGGTGNDTLIGDAGNDIISDVSGDEFYEFSISFDGTGYGNDEIIDEGGFDTIVFGQNFPLLGEGTVDTGGGRGGRGGPGEEGGDAIASIDNLPDEFVVYRNNDDLLLNLNSEDTLTIKNWFLSDDFKIEEFVFSREDLSDPRNEEGSILTLTLSDTDIEGLVQDITTKPQSNFSLVDLQIDQGSTLNFTIPNDLFIDPDGDDLTLSASVIDADSLPEWLSFDAASATFTGTPDNGDVGEIIVRVTATESSGQFASDSFILTVNDVNDAPVAVVDNFVVDINNLLQQSIVVDSNDFAIAQADINVISALDNGNYAVIYQARDEINFDYQLITQIYDSNQQPVGAALTLSMDSERGTASISGSLNNGNLLVTWQEASAEEVEEIKAQIIDENGIPVGNIFSVNTSPASRVAMQTKITSLSNGDFIVFWENRDDSLGGTDRDIIGQRFDQNGNKINGEFFVNSNLVDEQYSVNLTELSNDNFLVTWKEVDDFFSGNDIQLKGQIYDANANAVGAELSLTTIDTSARFLDYELIGLDNGGFAAAWESFTIDNVPVTNLQFFNASGSEVGNLIEIPATQDAAEVIYNAEPTLTDLNDGTFLLGWNNITAISSFFEAEGDYIARRYDSSGNVVGQDLVLFNEPVLNPQVAAAADGTFTLTRQELDESFNTSVVARQYAIQTSQTNELFIDPRINDIDIDVNDDTADLTISSINLNGERGTATLVDDRILFNFGNDFDNLQAGNVEFVTIDYTLSDPSGATSTSTATLLVHDGSAVVGTEGDDVLTVSNDNTSVIALSGNDNITINDSDNVTVYAAEGDDTIIINGNGNIVVNTGEGENTVRIDNTTNDVLNSYTITINGGSSADRYEILSPISTLFINDVSDPDNGAGNTLFFGSVFTPTDFTLSEGSLLIDLGNGNGQIHLENFDPDAVLEGDTTIDTFEFADGTSQTLAEFVAQGFDITGTNDDDELNGTSVDDRINGLDGNDSIDAGAGNDIVNAGEGDDIITAGEGDDQLIGGDGNDALFSGPGTDVLNGGAGDDTYVVTNGSGMVTINDSEGNDTVILGAGIDPADASVQQVGDDLQVTGEDFQLVFEDWFVNSDRPIENLVITDNSLENINADFLDAFINTAPELTNPIIDQTTDEDSLFSFTVPANTFSDENIITGDSLTYTASLADDSALPSWLIFDAATQTFSGTPENEDVGSIDVKITATDTGGLSASDTFSVVINNVNDNPLLANAITDQTTDEDGAFSFTVPANTYSDDDAIHGDTLSYTASLVDDSALPSWLSFDATTQTFTGTPENDNVGSIEVKVTATDTGGLSASDTFSVVINNVNDNPLLANAISDQSVDEDAPFSFTVPANTFSDDDAIHGDTLTYSATLSDDSALPAWLSFDAVTQTFSGIPDNDDVGSIDIKVTATDTGGLSASDTFSVVINNVNDVPTLDIPIVDQIAMQDNTFTFQIPNNTFSDDDAIHGDTLTYSATLMDGSTLPSWLSFDASTQTFSGTPDNNDVGNIDIKVTATDSGGLSSSDVFNLQIEAAQTGNLITGTSGRDYLWGTSNEDTINALAGNDKVFGLSSDDILNGGEGHDYLYGNQGNDTLNGGEGNDYLIEWYGHNTLNGDAGNDYLLAGLGNDTLSGGTGHDILDGRYGHDTLKGDAGYDYLYGGSGNDTLAGGIGNDVVKGEYGSDTYLFDLGDGQDYLREIQGDDTLRFGAGIDADDLWFSRHWNDLKINVVGTEDSIRIDDWYRRSWYGYSYQDYRIETIELSNGQVLVESQVQNLVNAMAGFNVNTSGELNISQDIREQLEPVIATSWS